MDKFKQGNGWHIRKTDGQAVNLNSRAGADYVLDLQARVTELEAVEAKPKRRGQPRKKVGPGETK